MRTAAIRPTALPPPSPQPSPSPGRMVKRLEDQLDLNPAVLRFTILVVKIVFLCHLIACAWMFMHTLAADRCVGAAWGCRGLHGVAWGCSRGGRGCSWVRRVAAGWRGVAAKAGCCVHAALRYLVITPPPGGERTASRSRGSRTTRSTTRTRSTRRRGGITCGTTSARSTSRPCTGPSPR